MQAYAMTNEEQAGYWNGDAANHWLVHEERYARMLAPFTDHVMRAAGIGPAGQVLDIGCGRGPTFANGSLIEGRPPLKPAAEIRTSANRRNADG
jgi:hypothetical protein